MARYRGEYVRRTRRTGSPRGCDFTARVHHAAIADRSKQKRQRQLSAEDGCTQICVRCCHCVSGTKGDGVEGATILSHRHLALGSSVDVIKDDFRNPAVSERPEIVDVHDTRRGYGTRTDGHAAISLCRIVSPRHPSADNDPQIAVNDNAD